MAAWADWAKKHVAPRAAAMDAENTFNLVAWQDMAGKGFWDEILDRPEQTESWWNFLAATAGMTSTALDSGFVLSVVAQAAFIRGIHGFASPEQKQRLLPELRKGCLTATAIAEPQSGTDAMASQTEIRQDGEQWLVTGEKTNIAHAPTARFLLITGKHLEDGRLGAILVENTNEGFQALPPDDKMGMRSLPTGSIVLQNVPGEIVGKPEDGRKVLNTIGLFARASYGLLLSKLPLPVVKHAVEWLSGRHSLGIALLKHQHVQHHLTEVSIGLQTTESVAMEALAHVLEGSPEALRLASTSKILSNQQFLLAMEHLLALQGSLGYHRGDTERLLRDAHGWRNVGGTEEMHRMILTQTMMAGLK